LAFRYARLRCGSALTLSRGRIKGIQVPPFAAFPDLRVKGSPRANGRLRLPTVNIELLSQHGEALRILDLEEPDLAKRLV
jgi:hypothetical protein